MILTCHWDYSFNVGPPVPKAGYFYFGNKKAPEGGAALCFIEGGGTMLARLSQGLLFIRVWVSIYTHGEIRDFLLLGQWKHTNLPF